MKNLKELVLQATDGGRKIFEDLYPEAREIFQQKNGKGYIKLRNEKTASASFKLIDNNGDKYWIVKDFGDDTTMNAIDAYMHENSIRYFSEALYRLADLYNVKFGLNTDINKPQIEYRNAKPEEKPGDTHYEIRDCTKEELSVMGPVVKDETMKKYKYHAVKWYSICKYDDTKKRNIVTTVTSTENYPIFLHDCGEFQKIYKPFETNKAYRFFSIGKKPINYIFGLEEAKAELEKRIQELKKREQNDDYIKLEDIGLAEENYKYKLDKIIICSGERDAMCLAGMGYVPIWFNSESAKKNNDDIIQLRQLAAKLYNVPDSDETGTEKGLELAREYHEIYTIELPAWLKQFKDSRLRPCKDLRDFIELRPSKGEFEKMIHMAQCAKFWSTNPKNGKVEINTLSMLFFLKINGFCKYKDEITKETKYIRIKGYTITEYEPGQIRDFIRRSLFELQAGNSVVETFINSRKTANKIYEDLDSVDINFNSSDKDGRTLFFQNACVTIHHNMVENGNPEDKGITLTYKPTNNMYVWDNKIIPHKFKRLKPSFTYDWVKGDYVMELENNPSKVMRYLINASRLYWREELEKFDTKIEDETERAAEQKAYEEAYRFSLTGPRLAKFPEKIQAQKVTMLNKIYVIGYLMHQYKIASSAKAIWAMEWKNNEEGISNGRSGKSLMFQCFEKLGLSEMVSLNGRNSKLTDNNHFMDRVNKKTDILLIDDADRSLDFGTFYAMITGTTTVNPKNEKSFELRYEDAPNIVFTSNYPIPNNEASTMARILFVAFSDYYHTQSDNTDYKEERKVNYELGELFGADYTEEEYNADINFFIDCLQYYLCCQHLNIPAIRPPMESITKRILEQKMGQPFIQWANELLDKNGKFLNHPIIRQNMYEDYCNSIERNAEKKGKTAWFKALNDYVKFRDDLLCLNPAEHPFAQKDGRLKRNCIWRKVDKTYDLIYIQTTNCKELSEDIVYI